MILGQSIFDAVLDRLREDGDPAGPQGEDANAWRGVKGLNSGFIGATIDEDPVPISSERVHDAYFAFSEEPSPPPSRPAERKDNPFTRLTPQEIAEDMGLKSGDSAETLQAQRREFARHNHPDLAPEEWREQATTRMKIANLLVDEAIRAIARRVD